MRSRWPWPLILHAALWTALCLALVCVSAPRVLRIVVRKPLAPVVPFHSSDFYIYGVTRVTDGSERMLRTFAALPEHRRVAIFVREDDLGSSILAMTMAYLAWPHDVQLVSCSQDNAEERLAAIRPDSIAAVIFCQVKPPVWCPTGVQFGLDSTVVCLTPRTAQR
jgi:hypothetical protein